MIDPHSKLLAYLQAHAQMTGVQVVAGRAVPPVGWNPSNGELVIFNQRGGRGTYEDEHLMPSFQFKCYGETEPTSFAVYKKVRNALHQQMGGNLKYGEEEALGQLLYEPETNWPFVLVFFGVSLVN